MDITATFTLSTGAEFVGSTSEFATLNAFQAELEKYVGQPAGSLTWHTPDGKRKTMAAQHIVSVTYGPTGV